jgi:hypothetical protein
MQDGLSSNHLPRLLFEDASQMFEAAVKADINVSSLSLPLE